MHVHIAMTGIIYVSVYAYRSGQDSVQTHVVFVIHVSTLLDQVLHQLEHFFFDRIKE